MPDSLYSPAILRLATEIPHQAPLARADAVVERTAVPCGSAIAVAVSLDAAGRVAGYSQQVRACALGQASAALLGQGVIGTTPERLASVRDAVAAWLTGDDRPDWPGLEVLAPALAHRGRHGAIRLPWDAAAQAALEAAKR